MLMTPLRDILEIGVPIILASTGRARSGSLRPLLRTRERSEASNCSIERVTAVMRDIEGEGELPVPVKRDALRVLKNLTARLSPREQVSPIHPGILHTMSSPGVIVDSRSNRHHRRRHDATADLALPVEARIIGTPIPRMSRSGVISITVPSCASDETYASARATYCYEKRSVPCAKARRRPDRWGQNCCCPRARPVWSDVHNP